MADFIPVEVAEGTRLGFYSASDLLEWSSLYFTKGDVFECRIPFSLAEGVEAEGAFVVLHSEVDQSGGYALQVKSLGATDESVVQSLSKTFNRKPGYIHVCAGTGICTQGENAAFHLQDLRLVDGDSLELDYVRQAGKRLLKQVQKELGRFADEGEAKETEGEPAEKKRPSAENLEEVPRDRGKGRGPGREKEREKETEGERHAALRKRLEELKKKEVEGGTRAPDLNFEYSPEVEPERPRGVWKEPTLNSGRTFTRPIDLLGEQGGAEAPGEQAVQKGRRTEEPAPKRPKSVMAQLALRANASAGQTQPPAGGFPGGMGPTPPLGGGKKKKKKKKKSGKKKKKKSKKSRLKAQGGGGPGGSSSGSSSSQSSSSESSESSGSENSGYLPPLKRKSDRRPGSVLELLIGQVEAQLSELQGAGMTGGSILAGTKMVSFYHLMIKSTVTKGS